MGKANQQLEALGVSAVVAVVYTRGAARLLDKRGRERLTVTGEPEEACAEIYRRFERALRRLLLGP